MNWVRMPRTLRVLSDIRTRSEDPSTNEVPVALLVGAGVDKALSGRSTWSDFLKEVSIEAGLPTRHRTGFEQTVSQGPVEAAEAARIAFGRQRFEDALKGRLAIATPQDSALRHAMTRLVQNNRLRVVVSFNYSRDVLDVLNNSGKHVVVVQREHLPGWHQSELLRPPINRIHFIPLHGLLDGSPEVPLRAVLDQKGYDSLAWDGHYAQFLQRLFDDCVVVSVGVSWTDLPLRMAAASVRRSAPIVGRTHVGVFPAAECNLGQASPDYWLERAMIACYGVRPVFYSVVGQSHSGAAGPVDFLARNDNHPPAPGSAPDLAVLSRIADALDSAGDYESAIQRRWFSQYWERLNRTLLAMTSSLQTIEDWSVLARLERHLRHFLFIFLDKQVRAQARCDLWTQLGARYLDFRGARETWFQAVEAMQSRHDASASARGLVEFALGFYEVGASEQPEVKGWRGLFRELKSDSLVSLRLKMAPRVWTTNPPPKVLSDLRKAALDSEWESVEAKIVLDVCEREFRHASKPGRLRQVAVQGRISLGDLALEARDVARLAGCWRRQTGSVALRSLVLDPMEAEAELIGAYNLSRNEVEGAGIIGDWSIYTALLATHLDRAVMFSSPEAARSWLEERCGPLSGGETGQADIPGVLQDYWCQFHPEAGRLSAAICRSVQKSRVSP